MFNFDYLSCQLSDYLCYYNNTKVANKFYASLFLKIADFLELIMQNIDTQQHNRSFTVVLVVLFLALPSLAHLLSVFCPLYCLHQISLPHFRKLMLQRFSIFSSNFFLLNQHIGCGNTNKIKLSCQQVRFNISNVYFSLFFLLILVVKESQYDYANQFSWICHHCLFKVTLHFNVRTKGCNFVISI